LEPAAAVQTDKPKSSTTTAEKYEDEITSEVEGDRNFDAVENLLERKEQGLLTAADGNA